MARAGRKDRGLLAKKDSTGKPVWYVRLYHEGQGTSVRQLSRPKRRRETSTRRPSRNNRLGGSFLSGISRAVTRSLKKS